MMLSNWKNSDQMTNQKLTNANCLHGDLVKFMQCQEQCHNAEQKNAASRADRSDQEVIWVATVAAVVVVTIAEAMGTVALLEEFQL